MKLKLARLSPPNSSGGWTYNLSASGTQSPPPSLPTTDSTPKRQERPTSLISAVAVIYLFSSSKPSPADPGLAGNPEHKLSRYHALELVQSS